MVPQVCVQFVIVVFPDHTNYFLKFKNPLLEGEILFPYMITICDSGIIYKNHIITMLLALVIF